MRIESPDSELALASPESHLRITLKPSSRDTPLRDADDLVILGQPFETEDEATEAAHHWRGLIQKAFARVNLPADFGDRAAKGFFTKHGLEMAEAQTGSRVLNDVHGTSVFECEPRPLFARTSVSGRKGVQLGRLMNAVAGAAELGVVMSDREQLAYDLYSASFSETSADARFAMLMMAVETMIEPEPRRGAVRDHVDSLIAVTRASRLPQPEIDSLVGGLRLLCSESVGQAGRGLASSLGGRRYADESAEQFFATSYALRSRLIHGHYPRPTRQEVDSRAAALELFVRDILSVELLDRFPD